jgi:acyl transferase domain-containing protein/SAM-dependent methyltransferase
MDVHEMDIAVIGLAGRFPGASDVTEFWEKLASGTECVTYFTDTEYLANGGTEAELRDPYLVKVGGILNHADRFDAAFFGYTPRDAELMDPQQRIFLEIAHNCIEDAGYNPATYQGSIGVYAGASLNRYLVENVLPSLPHGSDSAGAFAALIANATSSLVTRVSYALNLRGPAIFVQSACSTSLLAIHLACQDLISYRCDMALAGGVSVNPAAARGYRYVEDGIFSPDGRCRAFDAKGKGTLPGSGAGAVLLKRLRDAIDDGDCIRAVIRGSAANNDGSGKVSFAAPSVSGQREVIALAHAIAETPAETIGYVEGHGTGTPIGDPIEVQALTQAFRSSTGKSGFCVLGAVKPNIGHLDVAAGVAGFIKTVLALQHGKIPPTLHFEDPNPEAGFADSPFYVSSKLEEWPIAATPRRAAVSSFGVGGTNVHLVLEQAPPCLRSATSRTHHVLLLSANSPESLSRSVRKLSNYLESNPSLSLADIAYTLQNGRKHHDYRLAIVSRSVDEARDLLKQQADAIPQTNRVARNRPVYFLFPGAEALNPGAACDLYASEPVFRDAIVQASSRMADCGIDLTGMLNASSNAHSVAENLRRPSVLFPVIVAIEHTLAQLLISYGVRPTGLIGHGLGEYTAACVSGVMDIHAALQLAVWRGRLCERISDAVTLIVHASETRVLPLLSPSVFMASVNGPEECAVTGAAQTIGELEKSLKTAGIQCSRRAASIAEHSGLMHPQLDQFHDAVPQITLHPPTIPYISNVSGNWIGDDEAVSPAYWRRHLCETVRFEDGLGLLLQSAEAFFVEAGPGQELSRLTTAHPRYLHGQSTVATLCGLGQQGAGAASFLNALGQIWQSGIAVNWAAAYKGEQRLRVSLPTYEFESASYWIKAQPRNAPRIEMPKKVMAVTWHPLAARAAVQSPQAGVSAVLFFDDQNTADEPVISLRLIPDLIREWAVGQSAPQHIGVLCNGPESLEALSRLPPDLSAHPLTTLRSICIYSQGRANPTGSEPAGNLDAREEQIDACILEFLHRQIASALPHKVVRLVDLPADSDSHHLHQIALADLRSGYLEEISAYRGSYRWVLNADSRGDSRSMQDEVSDASLLKTRGRYFVGGRSSSELVDFAASAAKVLSGKFILQGSRPRALHERQSLLDLSEYIEPFQERGAAIGKECPAEMIPAIVKEGLDRLCSLYILDFLQRCDISTLSGEAYSVGELENRLHILPKYSKLFFALLKILECDGILRMQEETILFSPERLLIANSSELCATLKQQFPDFCPDIELLDRVMSSYHLVLAGAMDAKEALFPGGNYDQVMPLIQKRMKSTDAQAYIALVAECVLKLAESFRERPIRILEIGGGEGLLTWPVIEMLQERVDFEYVFTDIGRTFVLRAEREARQRKVEQVSFQVFNFLEDSTAQGIVPESFDLVLAFNVVHVAPQIRSGVKALSRLLAPGGCLCLLEGTMIARPAMLFWGLEAGLWDFTDTDLRRHSALLSQRQWQDVLFELGFSRQISFPDIRSGEHVASDHCMFICQRAEDPDSSAVDPRLQAIRRSGSEVEFVPDQANSLPPLEALDGVFWLQAAEHRGVVASLPSELRELAHLATEELRQLQSFVRRSGAPFCCILSPSASGNLSPQCQMASIAAERLIASSGGETPAHWIRVIGDGLVSGKSTALPVTEILRFALSSASATTFVVPQAAAPCEAPATHRTREAQAVSSNQRPQLKTSYLAPRNPMEEAITRVWEEILGVDGLGVNDDFFEVGGESLIATQLATRIRDIYGVHLSLKSLFAEPTIAGVCRLIEESMRTPTETGSGNEILPVARQSRKAKRSADGVFELQA